MKTPLLVALTSVMLLVSCSKSTDIAKEGAPKAQPSNTPVVKAIAPQVPSVWTVPAGTPLSMRLTTAVSSNQQETGETIYGELSTPLVVQGITVAPRGTQVIGIVTDSTKGGKIKGLAHVSLQATQLRLDNGRLINIATNTRTFQAPKTVKRDAIAIGVTTGIGTAIGALGGKGKGAAIGAGAGAGAGTVGVLATRGAPAVVPAESLVSFQLRNAVSVPVVR